MKERTLRGMHRRIGVLLALFVFIQVASGAAMSLYHLIEDGESANNIGATAGKSGHSSEADVGHRESEVEEMLEFLHKKGGAPGDVYRVLLGSGLMVMVVSGMLIHGAAGRREKM